MAVTVNNPNNPAAQPMNINNKITGSTPEVAQAPKPVSDAEKAAALRARQAELRARLGISRLKVVAPEGYTPYWARKDDTSELARLDFLGFRVVKEVPGQPKRYSAQGHREDGTYVMGDVILMEIPEEDYLFHLQENSERPAQTSQAAKEKLKEDAQKVGAPTFVVNRKTEKECNLAAPTVNLPARVYKVVNNPTGTPQAKRLGEKATQTFKQGVPVVVDATGYL